MKIWQEASAAAMQTGAGNWRWQLPGAEQTGGGNWRRQRQNGGGNWRRQSGLAVATDGGIWQSRLAEATGGGRTDWRPTGDGKSKLVEAFGGDRTDWRKQWRRQNKLAAATGRGNRRRQNKLAEAAGCGNSKVAEATWGGRASWQRQLVKKTSTKRHHFPTPSMHARHAVSTASLTDTLARRKRSFRKLWLRYYFLPWLCFLRKVQREWSAVQKLLWSSGYDISLTR